MALNTITYLRLRFEIRTPVNQQGRHFELTPKRRME
jgi:hypothetical protein